MRDIPETFNTCFVVEDIGTVHKVIIQIAGHRLKQSQHVICLTCMSNLTLALPEIEDCAHLMMKFKEQLQFISALNLNRSRHIYFFNETEFYNLKERNLHRYNNLKFKESGGTCDDYNCIQVVCISHKYDNSFNI